ncbi:MAG TPA: undecaprenyldiphospho-muramoylpentapeptide beta-N-acetylglucosaminyltransferase [Bacillota bacterium]|jgi:UDP-N-acetylglucosamine--N-acetylmuramyl-(pentapeptide) pyrophosphoryl-undecaprenol N-acetylglucosamine transferase|nr:undecaprenyldiphospho-muramoylpentapeptide beta-N-acetylglucosaminyltransferase [Bacillota bacterium]
MKVIMTGGGTGGHIYPAIAIADKIRRKNPDASILFIGTKKGMESNLIPESGYEIRFINARGFDRRNPLKNIATVRDFLRGNAQAGKILNDFKPDIVIGTGGYVCAPIIRAAGKRGIPAYIHEQNAYPGLANRMLEKYAKKVFISFPESEKYFKEKDKLILTGNPIRKEFVVSSVIDYRKKLGIGDSEFLILSFAGSRGAERLNDVVLDLADMIQNIPGARLVHITGNVRFEGFCERLKEKGITNGIKINILPYADSIHEYMFASDLVISRSGAITAAELTACGKPSILIPSPNVTANHQYFNARAIADKGGAVLIEEKDLTSEKLITAVMRLVNNREALNAMAKASASLGRTDGADAIYDELGMDRHISKAEGIL